MRPHTHSLTHPPSTTTTWELRQQHEQSNLMMTSALMCSRETLAWVGTTELLRGRLTHPPSLQRSADNLSTHNRRDIGQRQGTGTAAVWSWVTTMVVGRSLPAGILTLLYDAFGLTCYCQLVCFKFGFWSVYCSFGVIWVGCIEDFDSSSAHTALHWVSLWLTVVLRGGTLSCGVSRWHESEKTCDKVADGVIKKDALKRHSVRDDTNSAQVWNRWKWNTVAQQVHLRMSV